MHGGLQRVGGNEVVCLEKIAADIGQEEDDDRKDDEEEDDPDQILYRVIGMRVDTVEVGPSLRVLGLLLDFDAVGVVRADLVQRHQVHGRQYYQHQRNRGDVKGEEA